MSKRLKILVAPLDWGLGHTSRCMPIIQYLQSLQHEVLVAANGASAKLIETQFPGIAILPIEGYGIQYSSRKATFSLKIFSQIPKILKTIRYENEWLQKQIKIHRFDLVISDNRYGLYHNDVHSVFMTHQLNIQTGYKYADSILQMLNYKYINRFDMCWILDEEKNEDSLAGKLSHPKQYPKNDFKYIGHLSHLSLVENENYTPQIQITKPFILVLLSGPEPMRSILEKKCIAQMQQMSQFNFVIIAGMLQSGRNVERKNANIQYIDYLDAFGINYYLQQAELVICRSGYSTIMDLAFFKKRAILIPTPGQTEQEYLAQMHATQYGDVVQTQSKLYLAQAIATMQAGGRTKTKKKFADKFKRVIDEVLQKLG